MKITYTWMRNHGACTNQLALFDRLYPKGRRLTRAALVDAAAGGLHIYWLADKLDMDASSRAEYERRRVIVWAKYARQVIRLRAEQEAAQWIKYQRRMAPLLADALRLT